MLVAAVLFIDSFLLLFLQVSISGGSYFACTSGLWLVQVIQRLLRFRKLKFISLNIRRRLPNREGSLYYLQANIAFISALTD